MTQPLDQAAWPALELGDALQSLGQRLGWPLRKIELAQPAGTLSPGKQLDDWIQAVSRSLGLEAESVDAEFPTLDKLVCGSGPALLLLPGSAEPRLLVVQGSNRRRATLLSPNLRTVHVAPNVLTSLMREPLEDSQAENVDRIVAGAGLSGQTARRVRRALADRLLANTRVGGCWLLRISESASMTDLAREAGLPRMLLTLLGMHAVEYGLWISSWWLLGWITLAGRFDSGLLAAWTLILFSLIPFRLLAVSAGWRTVIAGGALLKRRLLFGALRIPSDTIRHLGAGQLLGRVIESEAIEQLALVGGMLSLTSLVELAMAGIVLGCGAGSWIHCVLLLGWVGVTFALGLHLYRRQRGWTQTRLDITNDLTERMVGHRTRLAQERREHWNDGEDPALVQYLAQSASLDRTATWLRVLIPRGWFIIGILGLIPEFVFGDPTASSLAVAMGGMVLTLRAFQNLADGMNRVAGAAVAWQRVKPFWDAATDREPIGDPALIVAGPQATSKSTSTAAGDALPPATTDGRPLLEARQLAFGYPERVRPVLAGVDLRIAVGDRILLEGASGGGKSTLASILAGARLPSGGLVLMDGLDRETLGASGWRHRVAMAPQFHENHVLMGSLAFNLLLARAWPPQPDDLAEAEAICRSLGLGPLVDRMPGGMQQMVGDTGWQLSHGEKSRVFMARALLQRADCLIFDECFAALDPETLQHTLQFVLREAPTLLVIAHP